MRDAMQDSTTERRLHGEYWTSEESGAVRLIAQECAACGAAYLPAVATCVTCRGKTFRPRTLSPHGTLYTYTIVRGSGGVWPDIYTIGYVDFAEKVRVCGHLRECREADLSLGMAMAVEEAVLYSDPDGRAVKCFRFYSAKAAQ